MSSIMRWRSGLMGLLSSIAKLPARMGLNLTGGRVRAFAIAVTPSEASSRRHRRGYPASGLRGIPSTFSSLEVNMLYQPDGGEGLAISTGYRREAGSEGPQSNLR